MKNTTIDAKSELIDLMVNLDGRIKYHFVDGNCIQYCDNRSSPILIVSQENISREKNEVTWRFSFLETGEDYLFTEKIREAA